MSTLIVLISFQKGGGGSSEPLEPPLATGLWKECNAKKMEDWKEFGAWNETTKTCVRSDLEYLLEGSER